jgi:hypothetical protein
MNGKKEITELHIEEDIVDPEDIETLEDTVMAAVNEVIRKQAEDEKTQMGQITGGMGGMGGFPF